MRVEEPFVVIRGRTSCLNTSDMKILKETTGGESRVYKASIRL